MRVHTIETGAALEWELRLFEEVARHPEKRFLVFWQGNQALVVPKKLAAKSKFEDVAKRSGAAGWPVHVRATGGDATPQGRGVLNVTHVYTCDSGGAFDIPAAYGRLCAPIEQALGTEASRGWQPGAFCDGAYNVQWQGRKFAGTALRFRPCHDDKSRHTVLAHALMLTEPPGVETIGAINTLLAALGETRVIARAAHTGLPDGLDRIAFLSRLEQAFGLAAY